ncbi:MAG: glycine cleavage system protein GcvH [Betaproteobacteria bacterium]|nr:glycine cleavage system protein GcvH [Betaproteobacteria bacterium]
MSEPEDRRYSPTHQWARPNPDGTLAVGITDFAQSQLGDVMFIQLPEVGREVAAGEACALVESVKSASDVHAPASGTIVTVNEALPDHAESLNTEPYDSWLFTLRPKTTHDYEALMSAAQYHSFIDQET